MKRKSAYDGECSDSDYDPAEDGVREVALKRTRRATAAAAALTRAAKETPAAAASNEEQQQAGANAAPPNGGGRERSNLPLPETCLTHVLGFLAEHEPYGLSGPSLAARDIANASLACWDFYQASKPAFATLAGAVEHEPLAWVPHRSLALRPTPWQLVMMSPDARRVHRHLPLLRLPGELGWEAWGRVLAGPAELTLPQLKKAGRDVGAKLSGTKAQLIASIFEQLQLRAPCAAPAKLLRARAAERSLTLSNIKHVARLRWLLDDLAVFKEEAELLGHGAHPHAAFRTRMADSSLADLRAALRSDGILSRAQLDSEVAQTRERIAARRLVQEEERRAAEEVRLREEAIQQRKDWLKARQRDAAVAPPAALGGKCACGNHPSKKCANKCCRHCCGIIESHATCARHGFVHPA